MIELTDKQKLAIYKKSQTSGFSTDVLEEVYRRGYSIWNESFAETPEQLGFGRINSFISGGFAAKLDEDLVSERRGLWYNIDAKRKRIEAGSGERMRKPGEKGAPTDAAIKASQNEENENKNELWIVHAKIGMAGKHHGVYASSAEEAKTIFRKHKMGMPINVKKASESDFRGAEIVNKPEKVWGVNEDADPCWTGYKQIGMKTKKGRKVPNCVPEEYTINENKHYLVGITGNNLTGHTSQPHFNSREEAMAYKKKFKHVPAIKKAKIVKGKSNKHGFITPISEEYTGAEKVSKNKNDPSSRFDGTTSLTNVYKKDTPGQEPMKESTLSTIKKVIAEATYKGKTVPLNKPMKGDVKKSKVYVDPDGDGKAQKVNFGDKNMTIKKHIKSNKDSYCARSEPLGNDPTKANYWSRKAWDC